MRYEAAQAEAIPDMNEIVTSREQFYVPVSLDTHDIFCFDEREIAEVEGHDHEDSLEQLFTMVTPEDYIHLAGGILGPSHNLAVMQEVAAPGSISSFEDHAELTVPMFIGAGVRAGVHSDLAAEEGKYMRLDSDGDVGCGYALKRRPISGLIAERGDEIVADAMGLRPELFKGPEYGRFASAVVDAHGRLAGRDDFAPHGRRVVLTAAAKGAKLMLMHGNHVGEDGIINLVPNTSIKSDRALKAGLPAYSQDSWAAAEANDRVRHLHPHDPVQQQIAELIDTIGTMRALDVKRIVVRRPEGFALAA